MCGGKYRGKLYKLKEILAFPLNIMHDLIWTLIWRQYKKEREIEETERDRKAEKKRMEIWTLGYFPIWIIPNV